MFWRTYVRRKTDKDIVKENDLAGLLSTLPLPFVSSSLPAVSFTVVPLVGAFLRLAGGKPFPYKQSKAPSSEGGRTLACQLKTLPMMIS